MGAPGIAGGAHRHAMSSSVRSSPQPDQSRECLAQYSSPIDNVQRRPGAQYPRHLRWEVAQIRVVDHGNVEPPQGVIRAPRNRRQAELQSGRERSRLPSRTTRPSASPTARDHIAPPGSPQHPSR